VGYLDQHRRPGVNISAVPAVIGFAAKQAVKVLREQSFRGVLAGEPGKTTIAQSPGRGQVPSDSDPSHQFSGTVQLTTGR
jgi:hypothetical protein